MFHPKLSEVNLARRPRCIYNANIRAQKPRNMGQPETEAILIIDDDPLTRRMCVALLRAQYPVAEASEFKGAKAELGKTATALALVDIGLEHASHFRLVSRLRKSYPELRVIFTYKPEQQHLIGGHRAGTAPLPLPKPFTPVELSGAVRSALREPAHRTLSSVA